MGLPREAEGPPARRRAAAASVFFILTEAAVGAGLVLFHLVGANDSVARAIFMAGHLANTFVLLACLTLTAHWCATDAPLRPRGRLPLRLGRWRRGAVALVGVGKSGAVAALGDTLYPAQSVLGGLAQDVSSTAHFLVQLRIAHPILALAGALLVAFAASRVLQATADAGARSAAWAVSALALLQLGGGLLNLALLAPVWMQIVHLLLADLLWIAFVLLAVRALSLPLPAPVEGRGPGASRLTLPRAPRKRGTQMKYVYVALIVVIAGIVLLFKVQNLTSVTVSLFGASITLPVSILVLLIYVLGMLTGGMVLALHPPEVGEEVGAERRVDVHGRVDARVHLLLDQAGVEMAGVQGDEAHPRLGRRGAHREPKSRGRKLQAACPHEFTSQNPGSPRE